MRCVVNFSQNTSTFFKYVVPASALKLSLVLYTMIQLNLHVDAYGV